MVEHDRTMQHALLDLINFLCLTVIYKLTTTLKQVWRTSIYHRALFFSPPCTLCNVRLSPFTILSLVSTLCNLNLSQLIIFSRPPTPRISRAPRFVVFISPPMRYDLSSWPILSSPHTFDPIWTAADISAIRNMVSSIRVLIWNPQNVISLNILLHTTHV
jgi:hypothetical protein